MARRTFTNKRGGKTEEETYTDAPRVKTRTNLSPLDEGRRDVSSAMSIKGGKGSKVGRQNTAYMSRSVEMLTDGYVSSNKNQGEVNNRKDSDAVNSQANRLKKALESERRAVMQDSNNKRKSGGLTAAARRRLDDINRRLERVTGTQDAYNDYHSLGAKGSSAG